MRRARPFILATAVCLTLIGCATEPADAPDRSVEPTARSFTADSRVLLPGQPGDEATVLEPGESGTVYEGGFSERDVVFMEQMIHHHNQALEMSALAPDRAEDEDVKRLAERIFVAQEGEIALMQAWLEGHELPAPTPTPGGGGSHADHTSMPGMVSPLQMETLRESTGKDFDRRFLTFMISHHEGAIEMASPVVTDGLDIPAIELANDVSVDQQVEINRMREILDRL